MRRVGRPLAPAVDDRGGQDPVARQRHVCSSLGVKSSRRPSPTGSPTPPQSRSDHDPPDHAKRGFGSGLLSRQVSAATIDQQTIALQTLLHRPNAL